MAGADTTAQPPLSTSELPSSGVVSIEVSSIGTLCMLHDTDAVTCVGEHPFDETGPYQQISTEQGDLCTIDALGAIACT